MSNISKLESFCIGNVNLESPVVLAPMAGVTDLAFRKVCKSYDVGLMITEMVSCKALYYGDKKTAKIMNIEEYERPISLQIFGSDPKIMAEVVEKYNDHNHDIIDINMGCPAPKIVKNGEGSALMKTPKKAYEIIKAVVDASTKPVTVKMRSGWDSSNINAVEICELAQKAGASAVAIHGRTRDQFYAGKADWGIIKQVKNSVDIPVIGNGDVFCIDDGIKMKQLTNCDSIMVGRGAQGNPFLLKRLARYLKTGEILPKPTVSDKINQALEHFELLIQTKGEYIAILEMRKHAAWYIKGIYGASKVKAKINCSKSIEEIQKLLLSLI